MERKNKKFTIFLFIILCTSIILIYSTYAWFSSSLNVQITNFDVTTESDSDLLISLDGVTWTDSVEITPEKMKDILPQSYANNVTQWSYSLKTVSSLGITSNNSPFFDFYGLRYNYIDQISYDNEDKFDFVQLNTNETAFGKEFISFDLFLKNSTTSPYDDYIFFDNNTNIVSIGEESMASNAARIGFTFMDKVPNNASVNQIQNISCNEKCFSVIYEPYATNHTEDSINDLSKHGINLRDGYTYPTYAVSKAQDQIYIWSGIYQSNKEFNNDVFKYQDTITSFENKIYDLGDEITKIRVYVWIEGQDVDVFERRSRGYTISVSLGFRKEYSK